MSMRIFLSSRRFRKMKTDEESKCKFSYCERNLTDLYPRTHPIDASSTFYISHNHHPFSRIISLLRYHHQSLRVPSPSHTPGLSTYSALGTLLRKNYASEFKVESRFILVQSRKRRRGKDVIEVMERDGAKKKVLESAVSFATVRGT